jgi:uncharacterized protein YutE (UPF0331/DUF86 family)
MTMVYHPESIQRRLEKLAQYERDLTDLLPTNFESYLSDQRSKYAIERLLLLISETILDILDHTLAAKHNVVSDNYEEILEHAAARGLLSSNLYAELKGIGGFRDVLAHEYLALRDEQVHAHALKIRDLLPSIRNELERLA